MKKNKSNKVGLGAVALLASGIICKALGVLFRLPLTNVLSIEGIGIFQLIMSLYSFALVVTCGGVANSLSKLIGSARAKCQTEYISAYLIRAIFVGGMIGVCLGVVFFVAGKFVCYVQDIPYNKSYMLFLFLLPLGAMIASLRGYFQGYENMTPTAISQILEQVFKFAFGLLFANIFIKSGLENGVFGAFFGIVLSEFVAFFFLLILYFKSKKNNLKCCCANFKLAKKEFDKANFWLMFSASIMPLVNAFDGLIIVSRLKSAGIANAVQLFGLQSGIVGTILNFPLVISVAVVTAMLPNVSYIFSRGNGGRKLIIKGLKVLLLLILPTTFGIVAISKPLLSLFYKGLTVEMLELSFQLMFFGAFSIILTAIMQYFVMLLQANGNFKYILVITAIGGVAKGAISLIFSGLSAINVFALVLGNFAMSAFICLSSVIKLKRIMLFSLKASELLCLILATILMFLAVLSFVNADYFAPILNIVVAIVIGVVVYFVLTFPLWLKILKKQEPICENNVIKTFE